MDTFFSLWSCALHVMTHTVNVVPLLVLWENRHQPPVASYNHFQSFLHLWRVFSLLNLVTFVFVVHSVEEECET